MDYKLCLSPCKIEDDAYQEDLGFSLGQLGKSGSGRVRQAQVNDSTKARISKSLQVCLRTVEFILKISFFIFKCIVYTLLFKVWGWSLMFTEAVYLLKILKQKQYNSEILLQFKIA